MIVDIKKYDGMTTPQSLDPDLLRAFVFIAEDGSFSRAAERVGRTQSAVSMQVQRLETALGKRLFARGRGGQVTLTPQGSMLLERARELLRLNDQIWNSFHTPEIQGRVRLGTPDDAKLLQSIHNGCSDRRLLGALNPALAKLAATAGAPAR